MSDILGPPEQGVKQPPNNRKDTCREYLGRDPGYCPGAVQTHDENGRGFCVEHAKERDF